MDLNSIINMLCSHYINLSLLGGMQKREPFSAMGLLKSPMGLMIGFMVVCVFLLPKLMDQIGMQNTDLSTELFFHQ